MGVKIRKLLSSKRPEATENNQEIENLIDGMTPEEIELNFKNTQNENQAQNNSNDTEDLLRDVTDNFELMRSFLLENEFENQIFQNIQHHNNPPEFPPEIPPAESIQNQNAEPTLPQRQVKKGKIDTIRSKSSKTLKRLKSFFKDDELA